MRNLSMVSSKVRHDATLYLCAPKMLITDVHLHLRKREKRAITETVAQLRENVSERAE